MAEIAARGADEAELVSAKKFITGSYALRFDSSVKIASQLTHMQTEGLGIDYIERRNAWWRPSAGRCPARRPAGLRRRPTFVVAVAGRRGCDGTKTMPVRALPQILIDRIAAGEVVERPASAVKELVENAIDAGASRIEVVSEGGGQRLIRVIDDGSGMTPEDLVLAVERHATSKLPTEDLLAIATLGFRGEALPSIASVSTLAITTRAKGAENASSLVVEAGRKQALRPAALGGGTRLEVRDLFTPRRPG